MLVSFDELTIHIVEVSSDFRVVFESQNQTIVVEGVSGAHTLHVDK